MASIEYNHLVGEVLCFIDGELDRPFGEAALRVFAWQFEHNAPYQAYCRSLGIESATVLESWREIPAVPTDAFKIESQPLCAFPPDECIFCFQTSGTTGSVSGRHYMHTGTTYHASIRAGWRHARLPVLPFFSVSPNSPDCRHSSLSYMFMALGAVNLLHPDGHLMTELLAEHTGPVVLMGTALTFLHLMESENGIPRLPEGSWLMETGGYKGTQRSLTKQELYQQLETRFGVPPEPRRRRRFSTSSAAIPRKQDGSRWCAACCSDRTIGSSCLPPGCQNSSASWNRCRTC